MRAGRKRVGGGSKMVTGRRNKNKKRRKVIKIIMGIRNKRAEFF